MSFAFNAAPFNQASTTDSNYIQQKREAKNKTIKKRETSSSVDTLMQKLHNAGDSDNMTDFNPISPPHSESVLKTTDKQDEGPIQPTQDFSAGPIKQTSSPSVYENFASKGLNSVAADYYQQYVPTYYNKMSENTGGNKELLEKLNYMIHLLEEQQDEKTGHVTEEIILYSFLGVFLIFIVDSFARAGKYVR
jgi:hypothetical protein